MIKYATALIGVVGLLAAWSPDALTTEGMGLDNEPLITGYTPMYGRAPFGTIVQTWNLPTTYGGAGIVFVRDSNLFYCVNQTDDNVYKFDPSDGSYTVAFATGASQIAWGIHFDESDGTFWVTDINGSSVAIWRQYDGNGTPTGKTFNIFTETGASACWWASGDYDAQMNEVWVPRVSAGDMIDRFDLSQPSGSTFKGQVTNPAPYSLRGLGFLHHLPNDGSANSMILCNWYAEEYFGEATLTGTWIQYISPGSWDCAGNDVWEPADLVPSDSVYDFAASNSSPDKIYKIALGYAWQDLNTYVEEEKERALYDIRVPSVSSGRVTVSYLVPRPVDMTVSVFDESGRLVNGTTNSVDNSGELSLSISSKGVYFVRVSAGVYNEVFKTVVD